MSERVEKVSFWRGKHASRPNDGIPGRILVEEDTGDCFLEFKSLGDTEIQRIQLTDTRKFNISGGLYTGPVVLANHPQEVQNYIESNNLPWPIPKIPATKQYVDDVNDAFNSHKNNTTIHVTQQDKENWNNKVDKEAGKGLSSNDFTTEDKTKLNSIASNSTKVSYNNNDVTDGYLLGTITINDVPIGIYIPDSFNVSTATKLATARKLDGFSFDGTSDILRYGSCNTEETQPNKEVTITGYPTSLFSGISCYVKMNHSDILGNPLGGTTIDTQYLSLSSLGGSLENTLNQSTTVYTDPYPITIVSGTTSVKVADNSDHTVKLWIRESGTDTWYSDIDDFFSDYPTCDATYSSTTASGEVTITLNITKKNDSSQAANIGKFDWIISYFDPDPNEAVTLNINNTGAKPIYYQNQPLGRNELHEGIYHFLYNEVTENDVTIGRYEIVKSLDKDTTYDVATVTSNGLMSASDKENLNNAVTKLATIATGANNYILPKATTSTMGGIIAGDNVTVDNNGRLSVTTQDALNVIGPVVDIKVEAAIADLDVDALPEFRGPDENEGTNGTKGVVPAPTVGQSDYYLKGSGDWEELAAFTGPTEPDPADPDDQGQNGTSGLVPSPYVGQSSFYLNGEGNWADITNDIHDKGITLISELSQIMVAAPNIRIIDNAKYSLEYVYENNATTKLKLSTNQDITFNATSNYGIRLNNIFTSTSGKGDSLYVEFTPTSAVTLYDPTSYDYSYMSFDFTTYDDTTDELVAGVQWVTGVENTLIPGTYIETDHFSPALTGKLYFFTI